jgi:LysM repeat protein
MNFQRKIESVRNITCALLLLVCFSLTGCKSFQNEAGTKILQPRQNLPAPYLDPEPISEEEMVAEDSPEPWEQTEPVAKIGRQADVVKPFTNLFEIVPLGNSIIETIIEPFPASVNVTESEPIRIKPEPLPDVQDVKPIVYTVKKGDSLWGIARMYGLTTKELASENDIDVSQLLKIGMKLKIPPGGKFIPPEKRPVKKTGKQKKKKQTSTIKKMPLPRSGKYTVESGDSLWKISRKFGTSISELKKMNQLRSDKLVIGQVLIVTRNPSRPGDFLPEVPSSSLQQISRSFLSENTAATEVSATVHVPDSTQAGKQSKKIKSAAKFKNLPHYVASGDTLESISEMYGSKVEWILQANPELKGNDDLMNRMEIQVPCPDIE